jgi:hypothetical protein
MRTKQSSFFTAPEFMQQQQQQQHHHGSHTSYPLRIVVVCLLFLLFLIWSKWSHISDFLGFSSGTGTQITLQIGQQVSVEGILSADGDFISYTHRLTTLNSGVFGLKSKTVNLNMYTGDVIINGIVDVQRGDMTIIEVDSVIQESLPLTGAVSTGGTLTGSQSLSGTQAAQGVYLPSIGVYLPADFFTNYTLENSGEN